MAFAFIALAFMAFMAFAFIGFAAGAAGGAGAAAAFIALAIATTRRRLEGQCERMRFNHNGNNDRGSVCVCVFGSTCPGEAVCVRVRPYS